MRSDAETELAIDAVPHPSGDHRSAAARRCVNYQPIHQNARVLRLLGIAAAGATGVLARYGIGMAVGGRSFPWATLGINLVGSFFLGVILTLGSARGWSTNVTHPLAVGFLGAFTTFSTFSYETQLLLRTNRPIAAVAYVAASVAGGVLAAFIGYRVGQRLA